MNHPVLKLSLVLLTVLVWLIKGLWHSMLLVIDIIDGGDQDDTVATSQGNYNHMTGQLDSCNRADGFYDERFFDDYHSPL